MVGVWEGDGLDLRALTDFISEMVFKDNLKDGPRKNPMRADDCGARLELIPEK